MTLEITLSKANFVKEWLQIFSLQTDSDSANIVKHSHDSWCCTLCVVDKDRMRIRQDSKHWIWRFDSKRAIISQTHVFECVCGTCNDTLVKTPQILNNDEIFGKWKYFFSISFQTNIKFSKWLNKEIWTVKMENLSSIADKKRQIWKFWNHFVNRNDIASWNTKPSIADRTFCNPTFDRKFDELSSSIHNTRLEIINFRHLWR